MKCSTGGSQRSVGMAFVKEILSQKPIEIL